MNQKDFQTEKDFDFRFDFMHTQIAILVMLMKKYKNVLSFVVSCRKLITMTVQIICTFLVFL